METLHMALGADSYDILLQRGLLAQAGTLLNLGRKVLVVTDSGVPAQYAAQLAAQCAAPVLVTVQQGESAKSFDGLQTLLGAMLDAGFHRSDCVVAVGGGVVGDLAGFAAATYMRGVDFYNIPTTSLSQVDSSIGGKTAINFNGVKNIVGAFYQPRRVLVDPDLLATLPPRQLAAGFAEAIKAGMIADEALLALFETGAAEARLEEVLLRALRVKKDVVEQDEKEASLRRILNFGHTLGHGIESVYGLGGLLHGECVALGMLPMCKTPALRQRLSSVLARYHLPTHAAFDPDLVFAAVCHDKKGAGSKTAIVEVETAGHALVRTVENETLHQLLVREAKEGIGA